MEDQELGFNFISSSALRPSRSVFAKGLRAAIASTNYENLGIDEGDIFVSDDGKCDLSRLQMLFGSKVSMAVQDPSYPPSPLHSALGICSFDPTTPAVSNSQGERTRLLKELRAISVKDSFSSRLHSSASSMETQYRLTGIKCNNLLLSAQRRSHVCSTAKPIQRLSVGSSSLLSTATVMLSFSQGELAHKLTRLREKVEETMYLYKSACKEYQAACREYQAVSDTGKGELKDKLTELLKELQQTMSAEDLYNSACKELQAMSTDYLYNFEYLHKFACNSVTEKGKLVKNLTRLRKEHYQTISDEPIYSVACYSATDERKYEAGTSSKGKERMKGEGEDDVAAKYVDAIGSVVNEPLKDNDLLFSLPSQPLNSALSQTADEREHDFALPQQTEGTEHNFALSRRTEGTENKNWVKGLGSKVSHVIYNGMRAAAPCIGLYLLIKNAGKYDDLALQLKALSEALGAAGCPPQTVSGSNPNITNNYHFTLFSFGNPSTTVSHAPSGLLNHGNPSTTVRSSSGLINIEQINIGNRGNGVEKSGNK